MTSTLLFFEKYTYYFKTAKCVEVVPVWLHRFDSWNFIEFLFSIRLFKVFQLSYLFSFSLGCFVFAGMLMYTRNFLFSLRNCWKSTSKNLGHGLMHRPLSRKVWLILKNFNLLAPRRGQRGRNHLRRPKIDLLILLLV